jgi:hypothetical protein
MEKPFAERVISIVQLLKMNGCTKEYRERIKNMDTEQLATLNKLKKMEAQEKHKLNKLNGTNKKRAITRKGQNEEDETITTNEAEQITEEYNENEISKTLDDTTMEDIESTENMKISDGNTMVGNTQGNEGQTKRRKKKRHRKKK